MCGLLKHQNSIHGFTQKTILVKISSSNFRRKPQDVTASQLNDQLREQKFHMDRLFLKIEILRTYEISESNAKVSG